MDAFFREGAGWVLGGCGLLLALVGYWAGRLYEAHRIARYFRRVFPAGPAQHITTAPRWPVEHVPLSSLQDPRD